VGQIYALGRTAPPSQELLEAPLQWGKAVLRLHGIFGVGIGCSDRGSGNSYAAYYSDSFHRSSTHTAALLLGLKALSNDDTFHFPGGT